MHGHGLADLVFERADRRERLAVDIDDLVANQDAGLLGGQAGDGAGDEQLVVDLASEQADARIAHAVGIEVAQVPPQRTGEDVDQLVIGRIILPIARGVRRAELRQHVGDDLGLRVVVRRGLGQRPVAVAQGLPVMAAEVAVVEMLVHQAPDLVEYGDIRLLVRRHLGADRRGKCDDQKNDEGNASSDHECSRHATPRFII